ncbi:MAG: hypothetical protein LC663_06220, partial [Actinobacteria bacterium]|nr:hypothetical protein [Actinomycetota bacterium]
VDTYAIRTFVGSHRVGIAAGPATEAVARTVVVAGDTGSTMDVALQPLQHAMRLAEFAVEKLVGTCSRHGCLVAPCANAAGRQYALEAGAEVVGLPRLVSSRVPGLMPSGGWAISVPANAPADRTDRPGRVVLRARFTVQFLVGRAPHIAERCYERVL